ncbi:hypothetical protein Tco_0879987 [Tanacetum coccineum]
MPVPRLNSSHGMDPCVVFQPRASMGLDARLSENSGASNDHWLKDGLSRPTHVVKAQRRPVCSSVGLGAFTYVTDSLYWVQNTKTSTHQMDLYD